MTFTGAQIDDQVVVVTGGGTGIGAAIATRFTDEGANVVVLGRRREPLERTANAISALPIVADASNAESIDQARDEILNRFGHIDTLICNAGGAGFTSVQETDDAAWHASLESNLTTAFVATRSLLPALRERRGRVVIVSSLSGLFAGPGMAGYTTAKHALIGLTKSLARDYGSVGIRVNSICPGWVRTPMADQEMEELVDHLQLASVEEAYDLVTCDLPLRRIAEPHEVAAAARFLASEESSYITGATLVIDGGAHIVDLPTMAFERARTR